MKACGSRLTKYTRNLEETNGDSNHPFPTSSSWHSGSASQGPKNSKRVPRNPARCVLSRLGSMRDCRQLETFHAELHRRPWHGSWHSLEMVRSSKRCQIQPTETSRNSRQNRFQRLDQKERNPRLACRALGLGMFKAIQIPSRLYL